MCGTTRRAVVIENIPGSRSRSEISVNDPGSALLDSYHEMPYRLRSLTLPSDTVQPIFHDVPYPCPLQESQFAVAAMTYGRDHRPTSCQGQSSTVYQIDSHGTMTRGDGRKNGDGYLMQEIDFATGGKLRLTSNAASRAEGGAARLLILLATESQTSASSMIAYLPVVEVGDANGRYAVGNACGGRGKSVAGDRQSHAPCFD